jgi:hypothetical protein
VAVGGGPTQEARSQIMYSRTRSCGVSALVSHSAGKRSAFVELWLLTWKSLKMACPHCFV